MPQATKNQPATYHADFGTMKHDADLGIAILVAEDEEGQYELVGPVATINEAREIAASDMASRMHSLERGGDPGICPALYKVWSRNRDGKYCIVSEIEN